MRADDRQLARLATQRRRVACAQHDKLVAGERAPNVGGARVGVHARARDADRRLRRPVRVEHRHVRRAPHVHDVVGESLATDDEHAQVRHVAGPHTPAARVKERGHHARMRHLRIGHRSAEVRQQRMARHRHNRTAALQRQEALEQVHVKGLSGAREEPRIAQAARLGVLQGAAEVVHGMRQVRVREDASLGLARRPRRIQHVRRVARRHIAVRRGMARKLRRAVHGHAPGPGGIGIVGDDTRRPTVVQELRLACAGQRLVERQVHEARLQETEQHHVRVETATQCHGGDALRRIRNEGTCRRGTLCLQRRVRERSHLAGGHSIAHLDGHGARRPCGMVCSPRRDVGVARRARRHTRADCKERLRHGQSSERHVHLARVGVEERVQLREQLVRIRRRHVRVEGVEGKDKLLAVHAHLER